MHKFMLNSRVKILQKFSTPITGFIFFEIRLIGWDLDSLCNLKVTFAPCERPALIKLSVPPQLQVSAMVARDGAASRHPYVFKD